MQDEIFGSYYTREINYENLVLAIIFSLHSMNLCIDHRSVGNSTGIGVSCIKLRSNLYDTDTYACKSVLY